MRRLIAAALLLVFLISVCVVGRIAVGRICDEGERLLKQSLEFAESDDWETAQKRAQKLSEYVNSKHVTLSAFANRGETEELMLCCELLIEAAQRKDYQKFSEHRRTVKHLLYSLKKEQKLNAESFV